MMLLILLLILFTLSYSLIQLKQCNRRLVVINSNNKNIDAPDLTAFMNAQWSLYKKHQVGNWIGLQTGYDPEDSTVADYMYTEQNLEYISSDDSIKHTNSIVAGEIRADCEVCFDSERLKSKEVGSYTKGKLRSRVCGNVDLRGPAPTARGLSTEVCIRHDDGRIRVLLAHAPIDFQPLDGDKCQYAMVLKDIVVVRERLNKRPLKLDDNPDSMWLEPSTSLFEGKFGGSRQKFSLNGDLLSETIPPAVLPVCKDPSGDNSDDHNSDLSDNMYKRIFPGGIMIEAPVIILSGAETRTRISWIPIENDKNEKTLYAAEMGYIPSDTYMQGPGGMRIALPFLKDYFVDSFKC